MHRRALVALWLVACGGSDDAPTGTPLWADGANLRDADGRIALLHGVNARVAGVFDVTLDGGRVPLETIPPLEAADCARMRALGFDFLRLPINWSAIEPSPGAYDQSYLAAVDAAVQCAAAADILVLIDLHQDAYSKEIGEDGAPRWAIQPAPEMLLEGPLEDLGARRTSTQVVAAFDTFFDPADAAGLQARYLAMLGVVAARWADDAAVMGFEIFNEPPNAETQVDAFSVKAVAAVHAAAPKKLVLFEPSAVRNLFDFAPTPDAPIGIPNAVYAPHIYTYVFGTSQVPLENLTPGDLEPSVEKARLEADAWGTPLVIGEYGIGPTQANADLWMGVQQELHDRFLASDAFWVWKEQSQGAWGVFEFDASGAWLERPQIVAWISRAHAQRIAGTVIANTYDRASGALHLEVSDAGSTPHIVYVPSDGFRVTCGGAAVAAVRDAARGTVSVACDGVLDVTPP